MTKNNWTEEPRVIARLDRQKCLEICVKKKGELLGCKRPKCPHVYLFSSAHLPYPDGRSLSPSSSSSRELAFFASPARVQEKMARSGSSGTRIELCFRLCARKRFVHMDAVTRILRYLKSAPGKGLFFAKNGHLEVEGFTDADWAGSILDRRSTSGYFTFVGGNLVTWRSKKQKVVALSSAEAEFRGVAKGLCELLWLKRLMTELGFPPKSEMRLFCDNRAAIDISHNPVQHDRTKHIEVDRHFVKQNLDDKVVRFPFVRFED